MNRIKTTIVNLSPLTVATIYTIVTLLCPIMITSFSMGNDYLDNRWIDLVVVALAWSYFPASGNSNPMGFGVEGYGLFFLNPSVFINTITFTFLSILFAVQVVRFRMGQAERKQTLQLGALSILPAAVWGLMGYYPVIWSGLYIYVGPIPIQLLLGYIFMRFSTRWRTDILFEDEEVKNWWESKVSN
ncbi:MAG: hypothetical protein JW779_05885 [Candidatus Thorarchaeota archaeon]|nr:hypothetical protein [Candidatus Thorarchaeota archaeon]